MNRNITADIVCTGVMVFGAFLFTTPHVAGVVFTIGLCVFLSNIRADLHDREG